MEFDQSTTQILLRMNAGSPDASEQLYTKLYAEFRRLARGFLARENPGHTLRPTALVNEAYLKLVDQKRVEWKNRSHFLAVAAIAMRRVLVKHAVAKHAQKRGGNAVRVELTDDLISAERDHDVLLVDEALNELAEMNEGYAKIVECRFFAGMTWEETAEVLGTPQTTIRRHWRFCSAWLRERLKGESRET